MLNRNQTADDIAETWGICVDFDDHSLLIPWKLYVVSFVDNGVWVSDENGGNDELRF